MKNAMLINIWICIHFKTGHSLKKYCLFLDYGPVRH